jgi:uncharacterized phiE125 gp8 family phage protein
MIGKLSTNTEPSEEPVGIKELRHYSRVDSHDDNDLLKQLGKAARTYIERNARLAMVNTTYDYILPQFDDTIRLPKGPIQSIKHIKYFDDDGNKQTLSTDKYQLVKSDRVGTIERLPDKSYPSTEKREDAVQIRFVAGYGTADDVPNELRIAIKMLVLHWYDTREPVIKGQSVTNVPTSLETIIENYRIPILA